MKHYYDFDYFFDRKHSGSIRITTTEVLDTNDVDECIKYAVEHNLFEPKYADNIIYVNELTESDAKDMGFDIT